MRMRVRLPSISAYILVSILYGMFVDFVNRCCSNKCIHELDVMCNQYPIPLSDAINTNTLGKFYVLLRLARSSSYARTSRSTS